MVLVQDKKKKGGREREEKRAIIYKESMEEH